MRVLLLRLWDAIKIKLLNYDKTVRSLHDQLRLAQTELEITQKKVGDPKYVLEKTFSKPLAWFDYNEMDLSFRKKYYQEAQLILNADVFQNELMYLKATYPQEAVLNCKPGSEATTIRDVQMTINGFELIQERLESITNPDAPKSKEDVFSGV